MKVNINLIRKKRKEMEYSEEYMAAVLGISQTQYSRLENGRSGWDIDRIRIVSETLKLDPLEVLDLYNNQFFFKNSNYKQQNDIYLEQIAELKRDKSFLQKQIAVLEEQILTSRQ